MVSRDELSRFLADLYQYQNVDDYCENGLQVEGKERIEKILFGVSFNLPLLRQAVREEADALIVHHGIFQQGVFKLTGTLKQKVKMLLDREISLFGIHLPMDVHPELGHNALVLDALGAEKIIPIELGFQGENARKHTLDRLLEILHLELHGKEENFDAPGQENENSIFSLSSKYGFTILANGPTIPKKIAVITGGASSYYEKAVANGADTYLCGDIKEQIPSISYETRTNFVNLGHYFSEKPGILALEKKDRKDF